SPYGLINQLPVAARYNRNWGKTTRSAAIDAKARKRTRAARSVSARAATVAGTKQSGRITFGGRPGTISPEGGPVVTASIVGSPLRSSRSSSAAHSANEKAWLQALSNVA